jgi:hypothetical protein
VDDDEEAIEESTERSEGGKQKKSHRNSHGGESNNNKRQTFVFSATLMLSMEGRKHITNKVKKVKKFSYKNEKKRLARIEEDKKGNGG